MNQTNQPEVAVLETSTSQQTVQETEVEEPRRIKSIWETVIDQADWDMTIY